MTAATIEGAGVELAYDERGDGQPVVLVHGTASTRAIWAEVRDELEGGFRTIAYDRRAYGESGEPEGFRAAPVGEHGDDLIAFLRALDLAPALLCGHSFGAMTCLDAIVREPGLVRAAVLIEPPMLWLAAGGAEAASELRTAVEGGARERGAPGAVDAFLTGVGGPAALDLLGNERRAAAHRAARAFAADLAAAGAWSVPPRALRAMETPVVLVAGTRTKPGWREPCERLAQMLPRAELVEADSDHFVPVEAPGVVADAIRGLAQP